MFLHFVTLWPWPFDLKPSTSMISQGHSLYQVWRLWDHLFVSYVADRHTQMNALLWWLLSPWVGRKYRGQPTTSLRVKCYSTGLNVWRKANHPFLTWHLFRVSTGAEISKITDFCLDMWVFALNFKICLQETSNILKFSMKSDECLCLKW